MECGRGYRRRAGSEAVLHQAVQEGLSALLEETEPLGGLPDFLKREVHRYLRCGLLEHGFVRVRCEACGDEALVAFSCKGRGLCPSCGARRAHETAAHLVGAVLPRVGYRQWTVSFPYTLRWRLVKEKGLLEEVLRHAVGLVFARQRRAARRAGVTGRLLVGAVTQVQYFGSALQLSPHAHTLVPDGVFVERDGAVAFVDVEPPTPQEVTRLVESLARRVVKALRKRGLEDAGAEVEDGLDALRLESLQQSFALGRAREAAGEAQVKRHHRRVAMAAGISLHADTWCHANDRESLEKLCRYGARGALAMSRLTRREDGRLSYRMKRAVNGRELLVLTPLQLLKRLAAVCPPAGKHLVHFHGAFAPAAKWRSAVVALGRPVTPPTPALVEPQATLPFIEEAPPSRPKRPRLDWASLLKKTFGMDLLTCPGCGGARSVLAAVTDRDTIDAELAARGLAPRHRQRVVPRSHGPPRQAAFAFAA